MYGTIKRTFFEHTYIGTTYFILFSCLSYCISFCWVYARLCGSTLQAPSLVLITSTVSYSSVSFFFRRMMHYQFGDLYCLKFCVIFAYKSQFFHILKQKTRFHVQIVSQTNICSFNCTNKFFYLFSSFQWQLI